MTGVYIFQVEQNSKIYDGEYINYISPKYICINHKISVIQDKHFLRLVLYIYEYWICFIITGNNNSKQVKIFVDIYLEKELNIY